MIDPISWYEKEFSYLQLMVEYVRKKAEEGDLEAKQILSIQHHERYGDSVFDLNERI